MSTCDHKREGRAERGDRCQVESVGAVAVVEVAAEGASAPPLFLGARGHAVPHCGQLAHVFDAVLVVGAARCQRGPGRVGAGSDRANAVAVLPAFPAAQSRRAAQQSREHQQRPVSPHHAQMCVVSYNVRASPFWTATRPLPAESRDVLSGGTELLGG